MMREMIIFHHTRSSCFQFSPILAKKRGIKKVVEAPTLKNIGALNSQNTSDASSRKVRKNYGTNNPVNDDVYDAIASHQRFMFLIQSHIHQEKGQTTMVEDPTLKTIGSLNSQNNSDKSSRNVCKKDGTDKPVHDEVQNDIASNQKFMFLGQYHLGKEEGQKTMVAATALKPIDALRSQNTSNASSRKVCKKDGTNEPVHYEGYDDIASHQKFMLLVQSHLGQEEGKKQWWIMY